LKTHNKLLLRLFSFILIFSTSPAFADIKLPQLISDHMVLQRDIKLKIWGWASPKEKISVDFNGKKEKTVTDVNGKWLLELPAMKAGGPYKMVLKGNNQITLSDIYIGDVWFASGQSNMVLPMERLKERYPDEVANDNFPQIRNFFVPTYANVSIISEDLPPGEWKPAVGDNILGFGGTTYFFAKMLYQKYKVPIGIINSSVGGVPIEAWMSAEAFKELPEYSDKIKNFRDTVYMSDMLKKQKANSTPPINLIQPEADKGVSGPIKWTDPDYVPENWHKFWLPGYWADQGVKDLNGILYFRKEIEVPASMTGVPAKLFVGRIIDSDSTFVNGEFVGNITYQYPPRRYNVPAGLLKPGKNTIVVKVTSTSGKGGFVPDKNYSLNANDQRIDLRGDWIYQVGQVQPKVNIDNSINRSAPFIAQNEPTGLYNTMAAPAINYRIKGFLWYQGETNSSRPKEYAKLLSTLITDWRNKWGEGNIPFIYAQLPNFMEVNYSPSESDWAQLRKSQLKALSIPNTGMSVGIDAGEWNDIHPLNKKDIGERLALWAEYLAYGAKDIVHSGPIYQSYKIEGNKIILSFSGIGSGLMIKGGGDLYYFAIAGADKRYVWAKAAIEDDKVIVWNNDIQNPKYVRYAWADNIPYSHPLREK